MMFSYADTLNYLDSFINFEKIGFDGFKGRSNLEELRRVLEKMGNPHLAYRAIHVAGTKGKGSISAFVSSVLTASGFRTGLYISPHLSSMRERISVDGEMISEEELCLAVERVKPFLDVFSKETSFSFFEVFTLLAIAHFAEKKVDYACFECGLGGRLDATNVLEPDVVAFAPISRDHTQILGSKIGGIAAEKAGIVKKGARCVTSPQHAVVIDVIKKKCAEKNVPLFFAGSDFTFDSAVCRREGSVFNLSGRRSGRHEGCRVSMAGIFQLENASTALGVVEEAADTAGWKVDGRAVKKGLERAFLPARLETIAKNPLLVLDGAQNSESAEKLKYSVEQIFKYDKLILLLGLAADKDIKGVCRSFRSFADKIILTKAATKRAADPLLIKGYLKGNDAAVTDSSREALGVALSLAGKNDLILVAGSFYLAGEIRELVLNDK